MPGAGPPGAEALRTAWDEMIATLQRARDAIDDPALYPPPPSDRNLAEGYRYLLGYLFGAIERAVAVDPDFPYFRRALQPVDKATIENADALYLCAAIDGEQTYRVTGRAHDTRHWRDEARAETGPLAPWYVILEATSAYAGDTGTLAELSTEVRANTGKIDCRTLQVETDGSFEILLAPERPDGHEGNFVSTIALRRWTDRDGTAREKEHTARWVTVRELFGDWDREEALELAIERVGGEGAHPPPLDPASAADMMRRAGEIVNNQMRFWNEFYSVVLETYEDVNRDGKRFMPRNAFNDPAGASIATGGGQSTNIYAGGVFELAEDQALIVETRTPEPPAYMGFHLSNLWGESLDYANRITSLNAFQSEPDPDGAVRYVVAHRDPGVPNWLDTTGLPEGFMAARWSYSEKPGALPGIVASVVEFDDIRGWLPSGVRSVSPEERRDQIARRRRHVQRRYRQY